MAHDVFISYARQDKTAADAVCAVLESEGIRCWIAPRDILPGVSWAGAILEGITQSRAMVLVFSGHSNESPQVEREVERATDMRIPVVPLRIEDVVPAAALAFFISTPHWLDAFTPPLERHLRHLAEQLKRLLKFEAAREAAPVTTTPLPDPATPTPAPTPTPTPDVAPRIKEPKVKVAKLKADPRLLDGRLWAEIPKSRRVLMGYLILWALCSAVGLFPGVFILSYPAALFFIWRTQFARVPATDTARIIGRTRKIIATVVVTVLILLILVLRLGVGAV